MAGIDVTITNTSLDAADWESVKDEFFQLLVDLTPVDTGLCRDSWYREDLGPNKFICVNPTPYASYLDEGWSKQAPNGMIGPALAELPHMVAGYR